MAQYIDKSALVAEIERKIDAHIETLKNCDSRISEMVLKGSMSAYQNFLHFLDTLKEADLEKETGHNLWKPADGEDLPEYEREVIVLYQPYPLEGSEYAVSFGHRPDSKGWDGTSIVTGKVEHYTPKTYDKGGWNMPNIKWWLDVKLPCGCGTISMNYTDKK